MALIPIGPWKRDSTYRVHPLGLMDSTYRVHPLGLMDSTYRVPLLDSELVRLRYAWYYRIKSPSGPSSALTVLGMPQPSFWTLNAVEPRLTYPNLYIELYTLAMALATDLPLSLDYSSADKSANLNMRAISI